MNEGISAKKNYDRDREKLIAVPYRMSLRPGLLLLNLNVAMIIQCLSRKNIFNFTYLVRCLHVFPKVSSRTPGVCVP
jgi:hypothetical protein